MNNKESEQLDAYWSARYKSEMTGWDVGYATPPISEYLDQIKNKNLRILIPGAGNAYEAEYAWNQGFRNTYVLDISAIPLQQLKDRLPDFPADQLIHQNFFEHSGQYDLIVEQTFFCSFPPSKENRGMYVDKMYELLVPDGKLVGVWFDIPLTGDMEKRPFGGNKELYLSYLCPPFQCQILDPCYNSIGPRAGNELFGIFRR